MFVYPEYSIYFVLIIGYFLSLSRPFSAFLFSVFGLATLDFVASANTRTFLGPYLNLSDAFILIGVLSFIFDKVKQRSTTVMPKPVLLILVIGVIGFVEGGLLLDFRYEVIRAFKWALNLPILYFLSANLVTNRVRCEKFLITIFLAGVAASLHHFALIFYYSVSLSFFQQDLNLLRTIGFLFSPAVYILVAATHRPLFRGEEYKWLQQLWPIALILFASSVMLAQTRSQWIAVSIAPLLLSWLVKDFNVLKRAVYLSLVFSVFLGLFVQQLFPSNVDTTELFLGRARLLTDEELWSSSTRTRWAALEVETTDWINGNWFTGNGFAYQHIYAYGNNTSVVAWGHLGYISYLVRLGIVGFFVYAIYLPFSGIKAAQKLYFYEPDSIIGSLALIGLACFIVDAVTFITSSSYLYLGPNVSAFLFGAVTTMAAIIVPKESEDNVGQQDVYIPAKVEINT